MWAKEHSQIPRAGFAERIDQVAAFARERDLAGVIVHSAPRIHQWSQTGHVGYLTNWSNLDRITDAMVVVTRDRQASLLVPGVDYMRQQIAEVSWIEDVRMVSSPDPRAIAAVFDVSGGGTSQPDPLRSFGAEVYRILDEAGAAGQPVAVAGSEAMPVTVFRDLQDALPAGLHDGPDVVAQLRAVKSSEEVELMRQVATLSDACYQRMLEVLEDGMMGYQLSAEMDHAARRSGADLAYNCVHSAPGGDLARGKLSIKPHDVELRAGDYISVNAYVVHQGYWIQADRTGTIGPELSGTAAEMFAANLEAQDEALTAVEPGLPIGELVHLADAAAARRGYRIQGGRIGHGQGLDYSEMPFLIAGSEEPLRPGNVFVLHVCLEMPGTSILINPIADLCHVTADGVEVLNRFPRELFHA